MTSVIYLAGPIGNGHTAEPRQMFKNVRNAEDVMLQLLKRGWSVICPHLSYYPYLHWDEHIHWKRWMQMDYELIQKADAFFHMVPEKYGPSKGTEQEVEWARRFGIRIYDSIDDVPFVTPELDI